MYDLTIRYLASVFLDAESVTATPDNVLRVLKILHQYADFDWQPAVARETSDEDQSPRLAFFSPKGEWRVVLSGKRFDVSKHPVLPDIKDLGVFSDFCNFSFPILISVMNYFQRRGHRLAGVQEGLLREMADDEMNGILKRSFRLPSTFSDHLPFEWDWRMASHVERPVNKLREQTNTIVTIKRMLGRFTGHQGGSTFDRIRVDLDINTSPDTVTARFGKAEVRAFFENVSSWHAELGNEISAFIHGEIANE